MRAIELSPNVYRLDLGRYQAYLWREGERATLIDTGEPGSGPLIEAALGEIGLTRGALDRVVLTHFHDDHAGSAAEVASWGVPVVAGAADAPVIAGDVEGPEPNFSDFERELHAKVAAGLEAAPPVGVDVPVRDGDVLDFGAEGARVVATPGHTDGSVALYLPAEKVLFTGDIAAHFNGDVILGVFNLDAGVAAESFRRLAELDTSLACFGHGEPVTGAGGRLRATADALP
ncbi:MBL fold metallo-hydrolase [Actinomadura rayongensis]|uniref:MBL fold metallo-hydrolase n=1 Tax=Actinomadura rayongensis TaxID=1429076 RepID=A0A6I4WCK4_9ACTN|nr:MBL fold metallo-hydrolase [Actinomadura rayongensis]MXQ67351.1 MBL fold metallo-hydrolase [Actinomadura rayongensis]